MEWERSAQKEESHGSGESHYNDNSDSDNPEEDLDVLSLTFCGPLLMACARPGFSFLNHNIHSNANTASLPS